MDDWRLLQEYAETADPDAFAALVERHLGLVYATALRITADPGGAEDVSQATFILLEQKADLLKPTGSLASWLYQTAVFKARKQVTGERRRRNRERMGAMMTTETNSPEDDWSEVRPLIDSALESLGEEDRAVIIARHLQRMSLRETGSTLGITEAAAGKRVARAGERLRQWFESRGIRSTGDALGSALGTFAMVVPPPQLAEQVLSSALGAAVGTSAAQTTGKVVSDWLASRSAMLAVFTVAAVSPLAMQSTEATAGGEVGETQERSDSVPQRTAVPVTAEESEWVALWNRYAPPNGSYKSLMAAIAGIEDPLKRDVFKAVAFNEWVEKGLPLPADLSFGESVAMFELMLDRDPQRAAELAASMTREGTVYLDISSKLVELAGRAPEHLADFIRLVEVPLLLNREYGIGSWRHASMALPPLPDSERGGCIRDAVASLAESDPEFAWATVESLEGWHRDQALAGLVLGRNGADLEASIETFFEWCGDSGVKGYQLEPLLMKWIEIDPRKAITALEELQRGKGGLSLDPAGNGLQSELRSNLFAAFAERDFDACLALLHETKSPVGSEDRFYEVLASQVAKDPGGTLESLKGVHDEGEVIRLASLMYLIDNDVVPAVWEWCAARPESGFAREAADCLLGDMCYDDPELAVYYYLQHSELLDRFPSYGFTHSLTRFSVEDAHRLLERIPARERTEAIYEMLRRKNVAWDLDDCRMLYEELPESRRDEPARMIASRIAEVDPESAIDWALSCSEGNVRHAAIRGLVATWSRYDVTAAARWVDNLEVGDLRDMAAGTLLSELAEQGDPDSAMVWASDLSDPSRRLRAAERIMVDVAKAESPEQAERLLEASALTRAEKEELHERFAEKK